MTRDTRVVLYFILFMAAVALASIGGCVERQHRLRTGFESLEVGQTQQEVVAVLGEPSEVEGCGGSIYSDGRALGECAEKYHYVSLMEWRLVYFDRGGKVIEKSVSVSP